MKLNPFKIVYPFIFLWWAYLFIATQIVVVFDSEGYEILGRLIDQQGWWAYFQQGPAREPLFPLLVAIAMRIARFFHISYYYPIKCIGIIFLWLSMILTQRLLERLKVHIAVIVGIILYMGFSPTLTNSSLRLWSEFAAYPWVVLAVIWTIKSWDIFQEESSEKIRYVRIVGHALILTSMFLLIMFVKAVAEGVLLLYLWPFYAKAFLCWKQKDFIKLKKIIIFCCLVLGVFEGVVNTYKWCNYKANGHYAFTNRGDWAFYGNTARRMQPLTRHSLGAAILSVPNIGICGKYYTQEDCLFWTARYSDDLVGSKEEELQKKGFSSHEMSQYYIKTSLGLILANPLQEAFLMAIEAHKMFFWEWSNSFLAYPDWLQNVLYARNISMFFMTVPAAIAWVAFVFVFWYFIIKIFKSTLQENDFVIFWSFNFIFWFMFIYAFFFILDRYAFPIISLQLILIAFMLDKILKRCWR